jgi:hypothetical protein
VLPFPNKTLIHCVPAWQENKDTLVAHIRNLRADSLFSRSLFVLAIESNLAFESDTQANHLRELNDMHNIVFMSEGNARIGVQTTYTTKEQMTLLFMEALSCDAVDFYEKLVTSQKEDAPAMINLLFQQLENYSAKPSARGRIFTGKIDGMNDDLVMAMMMNHLYYKKFWMDKDRYGRYFTHMAIR